MEAGRAELGGRYSNFVTSAVAGAVNGAELGPQGRLL